MKKRKKLISCLCAASIAMMALTGCGNGSTGEISNELEKNVDYVFGMMNIPYADFYAEEGIAADTVDVVTTASTNKWGGTMVTGAYTTAFDNEKEDNYGAILGVTYPVAISVEDYETLQENLDELREANAEGIMIWDGEGYNTPLVDVYSYAFTELDAQPAAFKIASFDKNGDIQFSKINGETRAIDETYYTEENIDVGNDTSYGEYQFNWVRNNSNNFPVSGSGMLGVNNQTSEEVGIVLKDGSSIVTQLKGVLLVTDGANSGGEDTVYALRQMENVWVGARYGLQISWSAGISQYVHNTSILDAVHYASTMGETVKQFIFITDDGYLTYDWEAYLPVILEEDSYTLEVSGGSINEEEYDYELSGLPSDFEKRLSVENVKTEFEDEHFHINDTVLPGSYTMVVTDNSGKYASLEKSFTLSTDVIPATYDANTGKLVLAEGASETDFQNYLNNISKVRVNDNSYSLSGKKAVKVITEDGSIDTTTTAFTGAGEYEITIDATGYSKALTFTVTVK